MNFVYIVTCLAIIYYVAHQIRLNRKYELYDDREKIITDRKEKRAEKFFELVEKLIPKVFPGLDDENQSQTGNVLPPGVTPEMMMANAVQLEEFRLRGQVDAFAVDILRRNNYQITYADAYAKAESFTIETFGFNDRPLSPAVAALIPKGRSTGEAQPETTGNVQG